ncbi:MULTISPECIES: sporulation protein [unclassified Streptomyces]|uniref:sporulation protein n=1 Tax=unclassified Streptomyces TaxID=2593676 RepID=UPI00278C28E9|nr:MULTISPECIES: sporulation protein [unclassified Streptomyces]
MAFRKFLSSLGVGAPDVETTLSTSAVRPGDQLHCNVRLRGGSVDIEVEKVRIQLVTRFEDLEETETLWANPGVVRSLVLGERFALKAEDTVDGQVTIDVPWETPLTHMLGGRPLKGARVAVRTELTVDNAVDRGDFDEIQVHALPAQDALLQAYANLGFRFDEAEVKKGTPKGGQNSQENFWQEIEMWFPPEYRRPGGQLESMFFARHDSLDLVTGSYGPFAFPYANLDVQALTAWLDQHLRATFQR